jgi:cytochrome c biogenesis protein CcdA
LERSDIEVTYYDLYEEESEALWKELAELEGIPKVTPITLIGDTIIQGFNTADTTGVMMETIIENSKGKTQYTFSEFISAGGSGNVQTVADAACEEGETCAADSYTPLLVNIPFLGAKDVKQYSVPVLASVLGLIDGFNPCAMWVLVTFLIILVQVGDKRKMWQIAGLFILAETVMYYLILNFWFQTWDFIGLDRIVTPLIGVLAMGGGLFFLWEGYRSDGTCNVTNLEQRGKTHKKIKGLVAAELTIATALGIIAVAFSVNIIEFACSIGIPQAFTKILEINEYNFITRQFYMALYILFYMIDDFIVFGIALYSFEKIGLTTKYSKYSNLVGGVLMLALGLILLLKPEILIF